MISANRSFLQQAAPHLLAWVEGLVNKPSIELINGKKSVVLNNSVMYEDIEGLFADNFKNFIESPDAFSSTVTGVTVLFMTGMMKAATAAALAPVAMMTSLRTIPVRPATSVPAVGR